MSESGNGCVAGLYLSLPTLLTALFVALRLAGIIDWPWWVVLSPTWVPLAFLWALVMLLLFIGRKG